MAAGIEVINMKIGLPLDLGQAAAGQHKNLDPLIAELHQRN